jgi:uncharacterized protein (DUF488 family)
MSLSHEMQGITILTVGHSAWTLEDFIRLLQAQAVRIVVDVRTVPRSRHVPQFNKETLPANLAAAEIGYIHLPGLGGLRHPRPDSMNMGWHNPSFRGFADYMQTNEFEENLQVLIRLARREQITVMCAEAVPWRCHRLLIADALTIRGIRVGHITGLTSRQPHHITPWAQMDGTRIIYPPVKLNRKTGELIRT